MTHYHSCNKPKPSSSGKIENTHTGTGTIDHKGKLEGNVNHQGKVDGNVTIKIDGITHSFKSVDDLAKTFNNLSSTHGEKVVATFLDAAHGRAVSEILSGFVALVICLVAIANIKKFWYDKDEVRHVMGCIVCAAAGFSFFMMASSYLLNPNTYKALHSPEIYIADKILNKVR